MGIFNYFVLLVKQKGKQNKMLMLKFRAACHFAVVILVLSIYRSSLCMRICVLRVS